MSTTICRTWWSLYHSLGLHFIQWGVLVKFDQIKNEESTIRFCSAIQCHLENTLLATASFFNMTNIPNTLPVEEKHALTANAKWTLSVMDWLPQSSDLNIIEAVWDLNGEQNKRQPTSKEKLWMSFNRLLEEFLKTTWRKGMKACLREFRISWSIKVTFKLIRIGQILFWFYIIYLQVCLHPFSHFYIKKRERNKTWLETFAQ